MRVCTIFSCLAVAALGWSPGADAQGPVREGLRRTGEIAVEGTRGVVQGAGRVVQGAGQAAAGVARGAGQAAVGTARTAAGGVRAGVGALTPNIPWQGRADANLSVADRAHNARWRMQRHNGEWWYYSPQNSWMYHRDGRWNDFAEGSYAPPQGHSTGYRGVDQGGQFAQGQQGLEGQEIRTDAHGRQFICRDGKPVYLDQGHAGQASGEYGAAHSGQFQQDQAQGQQLSPTPAPADQQGAQGAVQTQPGQAQTPPAEQSQLQPTQPQQSSQASQATAGAAPSGDGGVSTEGAPQSPREINNEPASPNQSGDATTRGSGDGDTLN